MSKVKNFGTKAYVCARYFLRPIKENIIRMMLWI